VNVIKKDGTKEKINILNIRKQTEPAVKGLGLSFEELEMDSAIFFKDGIQTTEIQTALIMTALNKVDVDRSKWTYVAARLKLYDMYHTIKSIYDRKGTGDVYKKVTLNNYISSNESLFSEFIHKYSDEEITILNDTIVGSRDELFDYLGLEACLERMSMKNKDKQVIELIQHLHMSIAMYIAQNEEHKMKWAKTFYEELSLLKIINASPINSNGRKRGGSTASCMIHSIPDTLDGIFDCFKEIAQGSKVGAGWGIDLTRIRSLASSIDGVYGVAGGSVPFVKILNDIAIAVDQKGNRPGAFAIYMETWDLDIFDFIDLKKKNGEERRRARDLMLALSCSDVYMERVDSEGTWTLFDPKDVRDLTEIHGEEFRSRYEYYELDFKKNPGKYNPNTKIIDAKELMRKQAISYFEEGQPFVFYKDTVNKHNKRKEQGIIRSSNLCVAGNTNILTKKYGYTEIGKLVESGVKELDCWNGEEWSTTEIFKTSSSENIITIGLSNGQEIHATEYHKWYKPIFDNYGKVIGETEVRTNELQLEDKLIKFDLPVVDHGTIEMPHAYTNGLFTSDGSVVNSYRDIIKLYNEKIELIHRMTGYSTINDALYVNENNNKMIAVNFVNSPLYHKFFIPDNSFTIKSRLEWLAGLFDGDGTLTNNNGAESIQLGSTNKEFLSELTLFLQELGIDSKVSLMKESGYRDLPNNKGGKSSYLCSALYRLLIPGSNLIKLLDLGYKGSRVHPTRRVYNRSCSRFINVTSIKESIYTISTYCGTEPKRNKLMFNGVLTGNCTEYMGATDGSDIPVCNLGSLNLARMTSVQDLKRSTGILTRMLDNIIDITEYPNDKTRQTQMKRRAIGIGALGEAELLANLKIHYGSERHLELIDELYGAIKEAANETTRELAKEKGGCYLEDERNSFLMCVAPNSTSGLFAGTTNSHEAVFDKTWIEDNKLGNIKVTAPNINIDNFEYYVSAYDVDQKKAMDATAVKQKHVDMGISHNIFLKPENTTLKDVVELIVYAWKIGLKTTYYLRSEPPCNGKIKSDEIVCSTCEN